MYRTIKQKHKSALSATSGKTTVSDRHQKYTYLFPFHAKRVRVRVAVDSVVFPYGLQIYKFSTRKILCRAATVEKWSDRPAASHNSTTTTYHAEICKQNIDNTYTEQIISENAKRKMLVRVRINNTLAHCIIILVLVLVGVGRRSCKAYSGLFNG